MDDEGVNWKSCKTLLKSDICSFLEVKFFKKGRNNWKNEEKKTHVSSCTLFSSFYLTSRFVYSVHYPSELFSIVSSFFEISDSSRA